jgi:hypothetical protein
MARIEKTSRNFQSMAYIIAQIAPHLVLNVIESSLKYVDIWLQPNVGWQKQHDEYKIHPRFFAV